MKFLKYALFCTAAFALSGTMTSCSDDEVAGSGAISFSKATYSFKESAGMVKIPVVFSEEAQNISFDVTAAVTGGDKKIDELVHFTQTENLHYAGDPKNPVFVEMQIFDDDYINDSRFLTLTITPHAPATAEVAVATIEIADNDNNPYERLWGNWTFTGKSVSDNSDVTFDVNISGGFTDEEVAENANKKLVCWGFNGYQEDGIPASYCSPKQPVWYISYEEETKSLSINVGTTLADIFSFGIDGYSKFSIVTASLDMSDENADFSEFVQIKGTWNDELTKLTFEPNQALCGKIYGDGAYTKYYWVGFYNIVMTRK